MTDAAQAWILPMPETQFSFMRKVLEAPSPIGLEGGMTYGVLKPYMEEHKLDGWKIHQLVGNAGLVLDTRPDDTEAFTVMAIGHADKIRMQVRSIGDDGKIWVNSDSFLPCTLLGHPVKLFSEDAGKRGSYRVLRGGTIEAIGAIHFADAELRDGRKGIKAEQLYLELQLHGSERRKQVEDLGICPGDAILFDRPVRPGFASDTFVGPYLDNGLGCFAVAELGRLLAEGGELQNIRFLGAMATHEEIGRFGSRVLAGQFRPDVVLGVDVNFDYDAAPGVTDKRLAPMTMGKGFTLSVGAVASAGLNALILEVADKAGIPVQFSPVGRDTGTDAMAAALASIDAAATSIGFPVRNMHTSSETAHCGDVLAAIHGMVHALRHMDDYEQRGLLREDLKSGHPRLDQALPLEA